MGSVRRYVPEVGSKHGKLTITSDLGICLVGNKKASMVACKCDCGTVKDIRFHDLRKGKTVSCGCHKREIVIERNGSHGLSKHPLMSIYSMMLDRCRNENSKDYPRYGGRGIQVCKEWKDDFQAYHDWALNNGWSIGLHVDRHDNDLGYSPSNCRIITCKKNSENKSTSRWWFIDGIKYVSSYAAAESLGVCNTTIRKWCGMRIEKGARIIGKSNCYSELKYPTHIDKLMTKATKEAA